MHSVIIGVSLRREIRGTGSFPCSRHVGGARRCCFGRDRRMVAGLPSQENPPHGDERRAVRRLEPRAASHRPPSPFRLRPSGYGGHVETPRRSLGEGGLLRVRTVCRSHTALRGSSVTHTPFFGRRVSRAIASTG